MKKPGTRSRRTARTERLMVETLELRRMCSATPMMLLTATSTLTVTQVAAGAGNLAVDQRGGLWYTAGDSLQSLTAAGTAQFAVPAASDGSARPIVSNVVFTQDDSAWFVVAENAGNRLEKMTAGGLFENVTPVTDATMGHLTVAQNSVWFTQSTPAASAIGNVEANGGTILLDVPGAAGLAGLTAGPDGSVWFTGNTGGQGVLGKVAPDGSVHEFAVAGTVGGIVNGQDGYMYFGGEHVIWRADAAGSISIKAQVNAAAGSLTETSDGSIWYVDASHPDHAISRLNGGLSLQYGTGIQGASAPNSMASTPDDSIWFTAEGTAAGWLGHLMVLRGGQTTATVTSAFQANGTPLLFVSANGSVMFGQVSLTNDFTGNRINADVPLALPPSDSANGTGTPTSNNRPRTGVYVLTLSAAANGSGGDTQDAGTREATGNAVQDPGTFEGEFVIRAPAGHTLPPESINHTYYSSTRTSTPALSPAIGQAGAVAASGGVTVPAQTAALSVVPPRDGRIMILPVAYRDSAAPPPTTAADKSMQTPMTRLVDWWRLTAYLSAASGLQVWWPSSNRQLYW